MLRLPRCIAATIMLASGFAHPGIAATQESYAPAAPSYETARVVSVGYVISAPNTFYGGGVAFLNPTFFGLYADFKISGASPSGRSNFQADWTPDDALNEFGDFIYAEEDEWRVFNAGITRVVGPELALYAGGGVGQRRSYINFEDINGERGEFGYYWVEDEELSGTYFNAIAGVFFRAGRNLTFQFGAEAQPRGMTVGVHYALPLR